MLLCSLNIIRRSEFLVGLKEPTSGGGVIWAVIVVVSFSDVTLHCGLAKQFLHEFHPCFPETDASSVVRVVTKFLRC